MLEFDHNNQGLKFVALSDDTVGADDADDLAINITVIDYKDYISELY